MRKTKFQKTSAPRTRRTESQASESKPDREQQAPKPPSTEPVESPHVEIIAPETMEAEVEGPDFDEIVEKYDPKVPIASGSRMLEHYDPLRAYLQQIRKYPLLSLEEERRVATEFFEQHSEKAAQVLVLANLRLVVKIAFGYIQTGFKLLDLIQEGNIGLLQAVNNYDPYKGAKFSYYASFWIKAYIQSFVLRNWSMVKIGTTQNQRRLFYNLKKEKQLLEEQGFAVTPKLLSERLHIPEDEVVEMDQRLAARDLSLDQPVGEEESTSLVDLIAADNPKILESIEKSQIQKIFTRKLHEFGKTLAGKERVIFEKRMLGDPPLTLQEIGEQFGITRERVRQIEARVLEKLKQFVKTDLFT